MSEYAPLKRLAVINERTLSEDTDPSLDIRYVDISAVGRTGLVAEPQTLAFANAPSRARRRVRPGDTIVSTVRTYLRAVWTVPSDMSDVTVSTGFAVISPRSIDASFLSWWLRSDPFVERVAAGSTGVSYPAIKPLDLGGLSVRFPPEPVQRAIADYLDAETARIDALIAKKRRLIDSLRARWETTLHNAFRFDALGSGAVQLRRLVELPIGGSWGGDAGECDRDALCIRGTDFDMGRLTVTAQSAPTRSFGRAEFAARLLVPGDLVVEKSGGGEQQPVGRVVEWNDDADAVPTNFAARLRPVDGVHSRYLCLMLRAMYVAGMTRAWIKQTTGIQNLDLGGFLSQRVTWPSIRYQRALASELDVENARMRRLMTTIDRQITLLQEHRQALITAAVTGELDVPGVAA